MLRNIENKQHKNHCGIECFHKEQEKFIHCREEKPYKLIRAVQSYRCKSLRLLQEFSSPMMAVKTTLRKRHQSSIVV